MTTTLLDGTLHCAAPEVDPRWFDYDATPLQRYHAQQTCIGCPAAKACLDHAIAEHLHGWYGGLLVDRNGTTTSVDINPYAADASCATTEELNAAHVRHSQGERTDLTIALNREYDRRRYQARRLALLESTSADRALEDACPSRESHQAAVGDQPSKAATSQ